MAKVLKITKQDKTVHVAPLSQKAFHTAMNNRLPAAKRAKIEEVEEEDVKDHPWRDKSFVTAGEAQNKAALLQKENAAKDDVIAQLTKQLAELKAGGSGQSSAPAAPKEDSTGTGTSSQESDAGEAKPNLKPAKDVIALIKAATKAGDVKAVIVGDDRKSVKDAADRRLAELSK